MSRSAAKRMGIVVLLTAATLTPLTVSAQTERLLLEVDRVTGATTLSNPSLNTTNIDFISYTLNSPSNTLISSDARWKSFHDAPLPNWFEANPTASNLSELASSGSFLMPLGASHDFGTPFPVNASAPLGTNRVNITGASFKYVQPNGTEVFATTQLGGRFNNLVLVVDPATGFATMQNQSKQTIDMISYTISSVSGALETTYAGSGRPGWFTANPTFFNLSELSSGNPIILSEGGEVDLGLAWFTGGVKDLTFTYQKPDGNLAPGTVFFGQKATIVPGLDGDFNGDGRVNGADYVVWRKNDGSPAGYSLWRANFGAGPGGSGAHEAGVNGSAVPEPTGVALAFVIVAGGMMRLRNRADRTRG